MGNEATLLKKAGAMRAKRTGNRRGENVEETHKPRSTEYETTRENTGYYSISIWSDIVEENIVYRQGKSNPFIDVK
ncbi:hypothetical protein TNCV_5099901 [Trichonephila clavipes]|uniref:Uncharacterized protein n=1 Tax=Trichonephila clavipes TaxID=2585209 RepID=A0A8X6RW07_TRICX|nr:hypothetical protein TNCV_5099901 [Trichonephila clavipes]